MQALRRLECCRIEARPAAGVPSATFPLLRARGKEEDGGRWQQHVEQETAQESRDEGAEERRTSRLQRKLPCST
jgi:hypothetical protein